LDDDDNAGDDAIKLIGPRAVEMRTSERKGRWVLIHMTTERQLIWPKIKTRPADI
jgi:hypothetical protein